MILRSLELEGFRNLRADRIEPGEGVNLFWGPNGAGKSNLLESVYYLFTTRSFRARRASEMVARDAPGFRIAGEVDSRSGRHRVEMVHGGDGREMYLDGKRAGLDDLIRRFSVLVLSSHQMNVLRGSPADRRRFLDRGILGLRPAYLREIADYNRTLAQRNVLLRRGAGRAEREAWDERFLAHGARVMEARRAFALRLSERIDDHGADVLPEGWRVRVEYRSDAWGQAEDLPALEALRGRRRQVQEGEARMGHSLFGPHRDDACVLGDGQDLIRFGSGGQQRSALMAMELTRMEMMREVRGETPLLLLDDIDSDLDDATADRLLERARGYQTMVTTCRDDSRDRHAARGTAFQVLAGAVTAAPRRENERVLAPADGER